MIMGSPLAFIPAIVKGVLIRDGVKEEHAERISKIIEKTLATYER